MRLQDASRVHICIEMFALLVIATIASTTAMGPTLAKHRLSVPSPLSAAVETETVLSFEEESIASFSRRLAEATQSPRSRVFQKRQALNDLYSDFDNGKYGKETRSIARYKHPDGEQRNLCAFSDKSFLFDYYMYNYKLIPANGSFIEVNYTDTMDLIYQPGAEDPKADLFQMNCKRPREEDGFKRLGDVVVRVGDKMRETKKALLVKAGADVLAPPKDYKEVWSETAKTVAPTLWQPVPPEGYACLGHVWTQNQTKPSTSLVRCVKNRFVESISPAKKTHNEIGTVWDVGATENSLASGTFIARDCRNCEAPSEEFHALKRECLLGYGSAPFCKGDEASTLEIVGLKKFQIPYARLQPCAFAEEDKQIYGLSNDDSNWEGFAIELFKDNTTGFVGYSHYGASQAFGKKYCLGSTVFGSSKLQNDLFVHEISSLTRETGAAPNSPTEQGFCYDPVKGGCLCDDMSGEEPCVELALASGGQGSAGDPCLESEDEATCKNKGLGCRFETAEYFAKFCMAPACYTAAISAPPPEGGLVADEMAQKLRQGELGGSLSSKIGGDFVFLFPCSDENELLEYRSELKAKAMEGNVDGKTENGVVNVDEDLGQAALFGSPMWSEPHFCNLGEEPTAAGACEMVDVCIYDAGGCIVYDESPCETGNDGMCGSGVCSTDDAKCGEHIKLYGNKAKTSILKLPRSIPYGVEQDGPGHFLTSERGAKVTLFGNAWKAFRIQPIIVSKFTVLEFDFQLDQEAEGHAICLDEDLNEDVEIKGANRCFRLAGSQKESWSEVWQSPGELNDMNKFQHYKIKLGSLKQGPAANQPYLPWETEINFIALVQDNDANRHVGVSHFRNLQLYADNNAGDAVVGTEKQLCDRRETINSLWGTSNPSQLGSASRSIARYDQGGNNLCVKSNGNEVFQYKMGNYKISATDALEVKHSSSWSWIYNDAGTGSDWDFTAWRTNDVGWGWYRLGDVGVRRHGEPYHSTVVVKGGSDVLAKPLSYTRVWKDSGSGGTHDGSCWKPNPPQGFRCLGHVWLKRHNPAPDTDYIRCVKSEYTVYAGSWYRTWKDSGSGADKDVSVWKAVASSNGLDTGVMVTAGTHGEPSSSERYVLKRECTLQYGTFPFCGRMHMVSDGDKSFTVPYATLEPCGFNEEEKTGYGIANTDSSHEAYSVELYKDDATGFVGYKHVLTSERQGKPYCLGTKVFGSSKLRSDVSLNYIANTGYVSESEKSNQVNGAYKKSLTSQISGDFVFMFPCSNTNDIGNYYNSLQSWANQADNLKTVTAGVLVGSDDLGHAASAGEVKWSKPHYCSCGTEPAWSGGCVSVGDACFYDPTVCPEDSTCASDGSSCVCRDGYLSEVEGTNTLFSSTPGDSCVPAELSLRQEVSGASFTMNIDNSQGYQKFKIDLKREDGHAVDQAPLSVFRYDGKYATPPDSSKIYKYTFSELLAGTKYLAKVCPVDSSNKELANAVTQETTASTHCCCDCSSKIKGDTSGRPVDFQAYQQLGRVMFNFTDNSRCAEAYAFTRSEVGEEFMDNSDESIKKVFAPNYYYYPRKKCGKAPVLPGTAAADDLRTSRLVVGAPYRYCVRAVAQLYSSTSPQSSDEACQIHHVRWQASLDGEVTSAPDAGGLPIEGVTVSWELLNLDQTVVIASGSTVTEKPGKFVVSFDALHPSLDRDREMPVRVKFFKTSVVRGEVIRHKFSCQGGFVDCTEDGTVVYLKHLTFEKEIVAYDMTAVPVRGRVTIMEAEGCPVISADVCLQVKHATGEDSEGACVQTDHNGDYSVVATIGSRVGVKVSYNNHTIIQAPSNVLDLSKGFLVDPDRRYERNDFVDTATAPLLIEVAGGLCNKRLGRSEIEVKVNGCDAWEMPLYQQGFQARHNVPAHVLDIRVVGVTDDDGKAHHRVQEEFAKKTMTKTIDLVTIEEEDEELQKTESTAADEKETSDKENLLNKLKEAEKEEEKDMVRFQYDGTLQVNFMFLGADTAGECDLESVTPAGTVSDDQDTTSSLHVTPTGASFMPLIVLKYELLEDLYCDVVKEDEMSVRVINKVGVDADFETYAATIKDEQTRQKLQKCSNDVGCNYKIKHDKINGVLSNAHCIPRTLSGEDEVFVAGRPKIHGDYRKDFIVEILDKDLAILKRHHAQILVTGDYVTGAGASFALPTYQPLLEIFDPPGGLSQATYENVETTIRVKSSELEKLQDFDFRAGGAASADNVHTLCSGAIVVYTCNEVLKYDVGLEAGGGFQHTIMNEHDVDIYSTEYTTTWSYTTSDDPLRAGRDSDIIVTPNLHVHYYNVENIKFDPKVCTAEKKTTVKFSLKDPGNKPALSFYSIYNIENLQMPELETAIANKKREIAEEKDDQAKQDATLQLETLSDALAAWTHIVGNHTETKNLAKDGKLTIAARQWFEKWAAKNETTWESSLPQIDSKDHWSMLAPKSLTDRAVPFDFQYIKDAALEATDKEDIEQTNLVQFSGGSGTVEFLLDHIGVREKERLDSSEDI